MVQLIVGKKGKGKTKQLLDKVNSEIREISGNIVYLDKSTKHMYELNNKVRLIDVSQCAIENSSEFTGFVCGILSQDHDLQQMYFDSFLKISHLEGQDITPTVEKLEKISRIFDVNFILSISKDEEELPAALKEKIIISL
ncbi:MAG: twitching motility protein PilT [Eubacterium sp.]|nr:twitching motility protein PilT [Eubacterium sp.]MCM1214487.1 twitching motility protein PilT [Lachnospiraceae bacterium]MCM1304271.1 twitching motility protein PilT [Butyrivibrio sp.]MCM1345078.1 twitching motility protein PilT [Muribaculaceae bacterium]MCM1241082.1 twitching motility protein PilT [Lachnospiraceae bacterium]